MKKHILLIPFLAILVLALFIIFSDMNKGNLRTTDPADYNSFFPFSAVVEVTEINKDRTHKFHVFSDGKKTLLDGYFSIENKKYPGKILFDGNNSYLFRPNPNQAVVYSNKKQVIYGFIPVYSVIKNDYDPSINITVLEKDGHGFPIKYRIEYGEAKSLVYFSKIVHSDKSIKEIEFALPHDTKYIAIDEYINIG